jgi:hypothetical protein
MALDNLVLSTMIYAHTAFGGKALERYTDFEHAYFYKHREEYKDAYIKGNLFHYDMQKFKVFTRYCMLYHTQDN